MSVIKINAITVPKDSGDELAHRFATRTGAVDGSEGFEGFELLKPTDGRDQWLVVTRWRDEESFKAWAESPAFARAHAHAHGGVRPAEENAPHRPEGAHHPVGVKAELWSYEVAGGSTPGE